MPAPRKVSDAQLEELLAWMELHPQLAKNSQLGCAGEKAVSHKLWQELASRLNSLGSGITKTSREWRLYWSDQKCKVRRKGSLIFQHGRGTGGVPSTGNILTPTEEQVLSLIGFHPCKCNSKKEALTSSSRNNTNSATHSTSNTTTHEKIGVGVEHTSTIKRKPTERSEESPVEKCQRIGPPVPPQSTLTLEERRLALEERRLALDAERLDENRRFHKQQEKFQTELLSVLKDLLCAVKPEPDG